MTEVLQVLLPGWTIKGMDYPGHEEDLYAAESISAYPQTKLRIHVEEYENSPMGKKEKLKEPLVRLALVEESCLVREFFDHMYREILRMDPTNPKDRLDQVETKLSDLPNVAREVHEIHESATRIKEMFLEGKVSEWEGKGGKKE